MSSNLSIAALVDLRAAVVDGLRAFYRESGVIEVHAPLLVDATGACENVDTLFGVYGATADVTQREHQNRRGFLSQTAQLSLETVLQDRPACWCHAVSFRDDQPNERHLREFELIEEEFSLTEVDGASDADAERVLGSLLDRIEAVVRAGLVAAIESGVLEANRLSTAHVVDAASRSFGRVSYSEALDRANVARASRGERDLEWGEDLRPADEAAVVAHGTDSSQPTFVVRFPTAIKFFNMRIDPADPLTVLSADLILPTAGETVGAAVRESDYDALLRRLHESTMWDALRARGVDAARAFAPYLRLIETGATPPHAGYGLGLDRLLQYIIGVNDIRSASATYRLATRGAETS